MDPTWIVRLDVPGDGPRLAVKDCIDVEGLPTTAGCQVVAEQASPAVADAPVVAAARRAGARIVGKTNLTELCWSASGVNSWSGTPVNPLDPGRLPGGSSSGSAVAVAAGEADVALGTDTGGSVRIPAACCGIAGLKTTWGRVPLDGVYPLASSMDTVGPLGADVAAVELGMRLIDPGFAGASAEVPGRVGRIRPAPDLGVDPATLRGWIAESRPPAPPPVPLDADEREELGRLRRKVRVLEEEREILKKAAAFFARETEGTR